MACALGFASSSLLDGYCADLIPVDPGAPRSIRAIGTTDFLVLDRDQNRVLLIHDTDDDGEVDGTSTIASMSGLNHGLALHDGYVYASTEERVYRWPYQIGDTEDVSGQEELVIENMEAGGEGGAPSGHRTRTLEFDSDGTFYVSIGSAGNVDDDASRSRVRRFFEIRDGDDSQFPIDFQQGEVFADGLRNTVGLSFDRHGVLWGVENGVDNLRRDDLGGDIHQNNPAEELNRLSEDLAGQSWGYPYCWTEFDLPSEYGGAINTRWAAPQTMDTFDDEYCRSNTQQSAVAIQAHSAVLGITFYNYNDAVPEGCTGTFPRSMDGYAFMAYHGSWNRLIATGYKVTYIPMTEDGFVPEGEQPIDLLESAGPQARWLNGFRPVDVDFDECGRLLVSSDGSILRGAAVARISYGESTASFPGLTVTTATSSFCLSGQVTVSGRNKATNVRDLKIGDEILAFLDGEHNSVYQEVYSFGHYNSYAIGNFIVIETEGNSTDGVSPPLEISGEHLLFKIDQDSSADDAMLSVRSDSIEIGDRIMVASREGKKTLKKVDNLSRVERPGVFSPLVSEGVFFASGRMVSAYTTAACPRCSSGDNNDPRYFLKIGNLNLLSHHALSHIALSPLRVLCQQGGHKNLCNERNAEGQLLFVYVGEQLASFLLMKQGLFVLPVYAILLSMIPLFLLEQLLVGVTVGALGVATCILFLLAIFWHRK